MSSFLLFYKLVSTDRRGVIYLQNNPIVAIIPEYDIIKFSMSSLLYVFYEEVTLKD